SIAEVLATSPDPQASADRLVDMANEAGGDDNITVIVVEAVEAVATAADPGATGGSTGPTAVTTDRATPDAPRIGRARRTGRTLAVAFVALFVVGAAGGFLGVRSALDGQWYVGTWGGRVAIYRGVPTSLLGIRLSHVELATPLPADEAVRFQHSLRDG